MGLWRASEKQRSQKSRGTGGSGGGPFGTTTNVISAYRAVKRPPPGTFQGAGLGESPRPNGGSAPPPFGLDFGWVLLGNRYGPGRI